VNPKNDTARYTSEGIASVAALAKRRAKQDPSGFALIGESESDALLRGRIDAADVLID
jgi:hypothetical protein